MPIQINQKHEKEIIALNTFESVRLRPGMYLGQVSIVEEKVPIIRDGKLQSIEKPWSPGFMHLMVEILENAIDEAKRMKGKMKNIYVSVDLDTNKVTIKDEGGGFHKAHSKHEKTKKNVVRTAMENLHAGSNFIDSSVNILGTHGVGSSVVNILSKEFTIATVNKTHYVMYEWQDFVVKKEENRAKKPTDELGTIISFIPSPEVFPGYKWDKELIKTYLSFKSYLLSIDPLLKNLQLHGEFITDGLSSPIDITKDFLPKETVTIKNKLGTVVLWKAYENSTSVSFINGSQCVGIQQKIINDWANEYFGYALAHHFYNTLIAMDVPSNLMRFGDQNKSKYDVTRYEIEDLMIDNFKGRMLKELKGSNFAKEIFESIEDRLYEENMKKIKRAQKTSKRKISDKYSPASKKKENIFLTEGLCLEENTKIFIIRKNKIIFCKLKNIRIGDYVITHNNNIKPIEYINRSIKQTFVINTPIGEIKCSENHKWFVYDTVNNSFYFEETKNINKEKHKLVKNYLAFLESFDEIKKIDASGDKIIIKTHNNEEWKITKDMNICVLDYKCNSFIIKNSNDLKKGDVIPKIMR